MQTVKHRKFQWKNSGREKQKNENERKILSAKQNDANTTELRNLSLKRFETRESHVIPFGCVIASRKQTVNDRVTVVFGTH